MTDKFDEALLVDEEDEVEGHALTLHVRDDRNDSRGQNSFRRNRSYSSDDDDEDVEGHGHFRHHRR
jgi:hypothetical protein